MATTRQDTRCWCWILALGNPQRQDDGIGPCVAACLRRYGKQWRGVAIESEPMLDPTLLEEVADAEAILFVDAAIDGQKESIRWSHLAPELSHRSFGFHHLSPAAFLGLLGSLYHRHPNAWLVAVRGDSFDLAEKVTPIARWRAEAAAAQIAEWVALQSKRIEKRVSHG
jgi:hydrogenase maturation protease